MRVISPCLKEITNIIKDQEYNENKVYNVTPYLVQSEIDGYTFWYNILTREIICFDHGDAENPTTKKYLAEHWFLVAEGIAIDIMVRCAFEWEKAQYLRRVNKLNNFIILTTMDCNARCPYCYEQGIPHNKMSKETALDVAKFIVSHGTNNVRIKWFGGEPLCNPEVIDIICKYLQDNHIHYRSLMITNGSLIGNFEPEQLKSLWHLYKVQITLDGHGEAYNTIKRYVSHGDKAFDIVIDNIGYLASNGIKVSVRLNLSPDNYHNLHELLDILADRFAYNKNVRVYVAILFEGVGNPPLELTPEERERLVDEQIDLFNYIRQKRLTTPLSIPKHLITYCMADSDASTVILPNGNLAKCEHDLDKRLIGTIYSDDYDTDIIKAWKEPRYTYEKCSECFYLPQCHTLKMCPTRIGCDDDYRRYTRYKAELVIKDAYMRYQKKVRDNP